jgi:hypothetical protein
MRRLILPTAMFLFLTACQKSEDDKVVVKVLIGATTVTTPYAQPINDSIIVIAGSKIRAFGLRQDIPVPQASDRTDLTGRWIVPAPGSEISAGATANLLILDHAPKGVTPASPDDMGARIVAGEWQAPKK